jgi:hypothetical protein
MGGTYLAEDLLKRWLIEPDLFERRANLLAANENAPDDCGREDDIGDFSLLSFY